jgi:hypothetical protein
VKDERKPEEPRERVEHGESTAEVIGRRTNGGNRRIYPYLGGIGDSTSMQNRLWDIN